MHVLLVKVLHSNTLVWSDIDVDACDLFDFAEEAQCEFRLRAQSIVAGTQ